MPHPRHLFSKSALSRLREFCRAPGEVVCAFDFDGTLAPIVPRPEDARMRPEVEGGLRALARVAEVVVISGRSVNDLAGRVLVEGVRFAGNHGSESPFVSEAQLEESKRTSHSWMRELLPRVSGLAGVHIEDKTFSVALHYRHAPRRLAARDEILALVRGLEPPPRLVAGKEVINLVHPTLPHKGTALEAFQRDLSRRRSVYVGDDVTDEDVFALPGEDIFKIRVGRSADSHATYFLPRQRDIRRLLEELASLLSRVHPVT